MKASPLPTKTWDPLIIAANTLVALAVVGLAVHFLGGDAIGPLAPLDYLLPLGFIAFLLLGAFGLSLRRRRGLSVICAVCALGVAALALRSDYRLAGCAETAGTVRVATSNVLRRSPFVAADSLERLKADVLGLVGAVAGPWNEALPGYQFCQPGNGLVIGARAKVEECRSEDLSGGSRAAVATVDLGGGMNVILVDVVENPFVRRGPALNKVALLADADLERPTVVVGGFNTPRRSQAFATLRDRFDNSFEVAGSGWAPNWPALVPLIDLDHVWVSEKVRPTCSRTVWNIAADRLPLIVDLEIADPPR